MSNLFQELKEGLLELLKTKIKTRKHYSRPTVKHKAKKGKGSYRRVKKVFINDQI